MLFKFTKSRASPARQLTCSLAKAVLVVEMSAGQMVEDVRLALHNDAAIHLLGKPGGEVIQMSEVETEAATIIEQCKLKKR